MNRSVMDRQMFRNGGYVRQMQMGGDPMMAPPMGGDPMMAPPMAGPAPQGMPPAPSVAGMPVPADASMAQAAAGAMQQGIDPAMLESMLQQAAGQFGNLDAAAETGDYEQVMNVIRGDQASLQDRRQELAGVVGDADAAQTPDSVLTLVQPIMQLAAVDQGIGGLAPETMNTPVTGDMAGGIMSTVNMGAEEVPPVNFNQGGAVQYFAPQNANRVAMPGGRLGELYGEKRDLYRSIMGSADQAQALEEQRNTTQAQMLFDIAQGGLLFASGAGKPGGTPAEQLAAAFVQPLGNIGARAGELQKFKQAQAKEARAMDIAALSAAEAGLTSEQKAASDLARQELLGAQDLAKLDLESRLDTGRAAYIARLTQEGSLALEEAKQANRFDLEKAKQANQTATEKLRQEGSLTLEEAKQANRFDLEKAKQANQTATEKLRQEGVLALEEAKQANRFALEKAKQDNQTAIEKLRQSDSQADRVLADKLRKENIQIQHDLDLNKMGVANSYELKKVEKVHTQSTALQDSRLKLQEAIAANRLDFDEAQSALSNAREDKRTGIQQQLADIKDREARLKASAAKIDTFGKSLQGKVKNLLEGEGSTDLANRYAAGQTTPDQTNQIEGAIGYYTNPQTVWNAETQVFEKVAPNKLIDVWGEALKTRRLIKGVSMPPIGQSERDRLGLGKTAESEAPAGAPPVANVPLTETTYDSLTKDIASIGAIGDLTGRSAALRAWTNRATEFIIGAPFFSDTGKAQNLVQTLNTTATAAIMQAIPGRESEQFRKEIKNILPPVAAFTSGSEVALNKTRGFEAYLNQQISALNSRINAPQPPGAVGELRQNAQILASYRDVYKNLGDMIESKLASGANIANRPPLGTFFKQQGD
jgi:hypothetical protein